MAFPGATHEVLREVTLMRTKASVSAFEAGLKLETPVMIETRASFHMQYLDRLDELAADPTIARPAQAIKLRAEEAQWLTEITRGMTVSFGCRRTECRFFWLQRPMGVRGPVPLPVPLLW